MDTTRGILKRTGWSRSTLYRYIAAGLPNYQPLGEGTARLFDPDEVEAWVRSRYFAKSGEGAA